MKCNLFILILGLGLITPTFAHADNSFDADSYILAKGSQNSIDIDEANTNTQAENTQPTVSTESAAAPAPVATAPAPVAATPAPVATTPAPVAATPAPVAAAPAPVAATPAPAIAPAPTAAVVPAASTETPAPAASAAAAAPASSSTPTLFGDILKKYNINPTGSVTLDGYSRYVWRGQYLDRKPVFEPGITLSADGLTLGYWSNWDANANDPVNSGESDYFMSYAYTWNNWTATVGHTWYGFPGAGSNSKEFNFSLGYNIFLSPTIAIYHDYRAGQAAGHGNGNYYDLTLSQTNDLYKPYGITYTLGATFGIVDHQWIDGVGEHFTPTLMVNIPINANMTVCPTIGYNVTAGALHDPNIGNFEDSFFGGVHTNINF